MNKRSHTHKKADSSASNPVKSQLQSRPKITQAQPQSQKPLTQTQTENQEFQQQKFEATKLELQTKYGTITPEGQEQLTVLQAKMSGSLHRRLQQASSNSSNFANIPRSRPNTPLQQAVQTKLKIGKPGDKFENEADQVAEKFVEEYRAPISGQVDQNLQQQEMFVEKKQLQMKPMLQLRTAVGGMSATAGLETAINQARGGGHPLAKGIRKPIERFLRADFSKVKVHTDYRANQLNQSIQAKAFTTGQDVFFRQGEYNPGSLGGKKLLAHELTHVVQQNRSAVQRKEQLTGFLVSRQSVQETTSTGTRTQPRQLAAKMPTSTRSETENLQPLGAKETAGLDVIQCVRYSNALPGNLKFSKARGLKIGSQRETEQIAEEQEVETEEVAEAQEVETEQEQAHRRVSEILSTEAEKKDLEPTLLAESKNVEKLVRFLRMPSETVIDSEEYHNSEKYQRYRDWREKVYERISQGAAHLVNSINYWRRQLLDENVPIDNCQITKVELAGSDLHERGLGTVFVEFTKPPGGQIAAYTGDTNIKVVIKPEDRNIEKSVLGSEPTSLANQINELAGLNTEPERLIETIKMETSRDYGTMVEFIRGETSQDAGKKPGKNLNSLTEAIAFVLLAGLSDINRENVLWKDGKPYLIDADNALNAVKLNNAEMQSGFELYDSERTKATLKDWSNDITTQESMIQKALLNDKAVDMIAAVRQAYAGKTGRVVPLHTSSWALFLNKGIYGTLEEGNQEDKLPKQTRWAYVNHNAEKLKKGGSNSQERGLEGEAGTNTAQEFYKQELEAVLIKQDLDKGQIPFYNYEYDTGHVIHNGQVIYHGQSIKDAEVILKNKFRVQT
ncbi:MAG: DUF4157 domain-containing protein [Nostoc sp.]|uniref:eCIS core domain-containing protein n=1 Tax=Nostoc sp. TaxID=1180 RepID=UPI002FF89E97